MIFEGMARYLSYLAHSLFLLIILCSGTKLKDFVAAMQSDAFQSDIAKLRHEVEEYAKQFPAIGFEVEKMKYGN